MDKKIIFGTIGLLMLCAIVMCGGIVYLFYASGEFSDSYESQIETEEDEFDTESSPDDVEVSDSESGGNETEDDQSDDLKKVEKKELTAELAKPLDPNSSIVNINFEVSEESYIQGGSTSGNQLYRLLGEGYVLELQLLPEAYDTKYTDVVELGESEIGRDITRVEAEDLDYYAYTATDDVVYDGGCESFGATIESPCGLTSIIIPNETGEFIDYILGVQCTSEDKVDECDAAVKSMQIEDPNGQPTATYELQMYDNPSRLIALKYELPEGFEVASWSDTQELFLTGFEHEINLSIIPLPEPPVTGLEYIGQPEELGFRRFGANIYRAEIDPGLTEGANRSDYYTYVSADVFSLDSNCAPDVVAPCGETGFSHIEEGYRVSLLCTTKFGAEPDICDDFVMNLGVREK